MSEPTPLSAERALNLLRMAARVDPLLRQAVADVEVHIDAQATEIAALKGALTKAIEDMQWMFGGWGITDEDQLANGRVVAHQNIEALRRVLAGKEAQGGD